MAGWVLMVVVALWTLAISLNAFLICQPLAYNWNRFIPGGKCGNINVSITMFGVIDLLTDIALFTLPIPMIYNLQTAKINKVALFGVFGLGIT